MTGVPLAARGQKLKRRGPNGGTLRPLLTPGCCCTWLPGSRRPQTSPSAISQDAAELIATLRKDLGGQGLDAGPQTIAWHLEHHHRAGVSPATVSRYLATRG